jgi:hypothetical protein
MPYTKAHYYMLLLLPVTVLAFWPSYFGMLPRAPVIHHLHGITGTMWILLIAAQSYTVQSRKLRLHRRIGKLVFFLTPIMVSAFALVTWLGAQKAVGDHPFYVQFGQALLTGDALLTFTTPLIVYLALRYRRNIYVHGALMISTVFGLLPPILARLMNNYVPGLIIEGLDTMYLFGYALYISLALTFVLAIYLYFRYRAHGWPWLLGAGITALMFLLFETVGQTNAWATVVQQIAALSPVAVFVSGVVLGLVACTAGWLQRR